MRQILLIIAILSTMSGIIGMHNQAKDNAYAASSSMIVIERSTGRVLYEMNADEKKPMASTTKIATAITVLENIDNIDRIVKIPSAAVGIEGSSIYLQQGEELSVKDLLYGLMLQSGNDCAVALALITAGNVNDFACLMNKTAKNAGAVNTNFTNPHGLHDDNHYTTAADLAKITAYAMKNPIFCEIVATKRYTMPWGNHEYDRVVLNKNKILSTFEGGDGVKTGYTKKAGRCLVASATRNGMSVICVVLNCGPMFEQCRTYMQKAFDEYEMVDLFPRRLNLYAAVKSGKEEVVPLSCDRLVYPLKRNEINKLSYNIEDVKELTAPLKAGEENGKINIYLENQLIFSQKLYTIYNVDAKSIGEYMKDILAA